MSVSQRISLVWFTERNEAHKENSVLQNNEKEKKSSICETWLCIVCFYAFHVQEFEVTFVIICPDGQEAPEAGDTQFVCEDISGSADVAECSSGNMTFAPQKNSTDLARLEAHLSLV